MNSIICEKIKSYFDQKDEIVAVYLFGSYATGNQLFGSDIDLGILFKNDEHQFIEKFLDQYVVELSRIIRKDIHFLTMNTAGELILKQVFSKGKLILVKDQKILSRFLMIKYSQILDYSYLLDQIKIGFVDNIQQSSGND